MVHRQALSPLSHTSQGCAVPFGGRITSCRTHRPHRAGPLSHAGTLRPRPPSGWSEQSSRGHVFTQNWTLFSALRRTHPGTAMAVSSGGSDRLPAKGHTVPGATTGRSPLGPTSRRVSGSSSWSPLPGPRPHRSTAPDTPLRWEGPAPQGREVPFTSSPSAWQASTSGPGLCPVPTGTGLSVQPGRSGGTGNKLAVSPRRGQALARPGRCPPTSQLCERGHAVSGFGTVCIRPENSWGLLGGGVIHSCGGDVLRHPAVRL